MYLIKNLISLNLIFGKDLETISKNFSKTVWSTFQKHNPFKFETWMLSRLKYKVHFFLIIQLILNKCLITLESILEGQTDCIILRRMRKTLPINVLKNNLGWIYQKYSFFYKQRYTNEAFNHVFSPYFKKIEILLYSLRLLSVILMKNPRKKKN